ncbi:hypothetical protein IUJ34_27010 (plasmid) [Klebsiella pneumoniae subsp. pneumoniae]|uniref:Uncharacterized protein n=1 Tax=Klebsiella pneumoniae subsp. pneumoniae TaxID=72407 RepID=A0A7S9HFA4_KLEPN|nr:hypothetical protein IUJ34_27010 [Klebsiella pneumoniae subsp. pneumoniae]
MGSNPWFDGSLETYSENQQISGSRAVVVSSQKRSGTKSLRVSRGAGEGGNSDKSIGKWIALRENAVFRIELWAMMPADQSPSSGWSTIVGLQTQNAANNNNWPSAITITEGSLGAEAPEEIHRHAPCSDWPHSRRILDFYPRSNWRRYAGV